MQPSAKEQSKRSTSSETWRRITGLLKRRRQMMRMMVQPMNFKILNAQTSSAVRVHLSMARPMQVAELHSRIFNLFLLCPLLLMSWKQSGFFQRTWAMHFTTSHWFHSCPCVVQIPMACLPWSRANRQKRTRHKQLNWLRPTLFVQRQHPTRRRRLTCHGKRVFTNSRRPGRQTTQCSWPSP